MRRLLHPLEPSAFTKGVITFKKDHPDDLSNRRWENFRDEQPEAYKALRKCLYKNQAGLCAYCEIKLTANNQQIEHIIPKSNFSKTKDYTFDFFNLLLCCKGGTDKHSSRHDEYSSELKTEGNCSCGEKKGSKNLADDFISPYQLPVIPIFSLFYHHDGGVSFKVDMEACKQESIDPQKIEKTLTLLGLNCSRLKRNRQEICDFIQEQIVKLPKIEHDKALLKLAEEHLSPKNDKLQDYVSTRFFI
jgi:uncharacterized protein (TIGR02646 family)